MLIELLNAIGGGGESLEIITGVQDSALDVVTENEVLYGVFYQGGNGKSGYRALVYNPQDSETSATQYQDIGANGATVKTVASSPTLSRSNDIPYFGPLGASITHNNYSSYAYSYFLVTKRSGGGSISFYPSLVDSVNTGTSAFSQSWTIDPSCGYIVEAAYDRSGYDLRKTFFISGNSVTYLNVAGTDAGWNPPTVTVSGTTLTITRISSGYGCKLSIIKAT